MVGYGTTSRTSDPSNQQNVIVEKAIREQLEKPTGKLTKVDLAKVTRLDLSGTGITDAGFKEVAKLKELKRLLLSGLGGGAINGKSGVKLWEFETGGEVNSSPAIGPDGTVYVGSRDKKLYAIKTDSKGLAKSPWPMRGQNPLHTGRVMKK